MRRSLERSGFRSRPVQVDAWAGAHHSAVAGSGTVLIANYFPHEMRLSEITDALVDIVVSGSEPVTFSVRKPGATIFETDDPLDTLSAA